MVLWCVSTCVSSYTLFPFWRVISWSVFVWKRVEFVMWLFLRGVAAECSNGVTSDWWAILSLHTVGASLSVRAGNIFLSTSQTCQHVNWWWPSWSWSPLALLTLEFGSDTFSNLVKVDRRGWRRQWEILHSWKTDIIFLWFFMFSKLLPGLNEFSGMLSVLDATGCCDEHPPTPSLLCQQEMHQITSLKPLLFISIGNYISFRIFLPSTPVLSHKVWPSWLRTYLHSLEQIFYSVDP